MAKTVTLKGGTFQFYGAQSFGPNGSGVSVHDEATPFLRYLAAAFPNEFNRALRHVGWYLRGRIQQGIKSHSPGGRRFKDTSDVQKYRMLDEMRGRHKLFSIKTQRQLGWKRMKNRVIKGSDDELGSVFGRLLGAVVFRHDKASMRMEIGWVSSSAMQLARKLQGGGRMPITARQRRFYWAGGIPLSKDKLFFELPARPVIAPVYDAEAGPKMARRIEERVRMILNGATGKAKGMA